MLVAALSCSSLAAAQSAVLVNCGDCGAFDGIELQVDGQSMNVGAIRSSVRAEVTPGDHEIKVIKWKGPFSTEPLHTQVINVPANVELRIKATKFKFDIYGRGDLAPAAPAGPSPEALKVAYEALGEAYDYAKEAGEINDDEDSKCQSKVAAKLEVITDNLKDLKKQIEYPVLDKTIEKAGDTATYVARECPKRVAKSLGKKLEKLVARLNKASSSLR